MARQNPDKLRKTILWLHRYLGLASLLFLLLASLTGSLLVFKEPLDAALNRDLFVVAQQGPVIAAAALADQVQKHHPEFSVTMAPMQLKPGEAAAMSVSGKPDLGYSQIFVDPHNGMIIGTRDVKPGWGRRHLVEGIFTFHYTLLAGTFGRWLMGIIAILWLIGNIAGFYLTLPSGPPFWRRWKLNWRINRGTKFPRFCLDTHRAGSLWLFPVLMILALTSVEMNFYDELFVPALNALGKAPASPFDVGARAVTPHRAAQTFQSAEALTRAAANDHPGWQPAFANYFPRLGLFSVAYVKAQADTYSRLGPVAYYVDDISGKLVYRDDPYREGARGLVARSLYPLHSGRIYGATTKAIIFITGLFTAILSATGLYLWWWRRRLR